MVTRCVSSMTDEEWSKRIRARDGVCRICLPGICTRGADTAAHVFTRKYQAVRHDLDNGIAACVPCHSYTEQRPELWAKLIGRILEQEVLDRLNARMKLHYGKTRN